MAKKVYLLVVLSFLGSKLLSYFYILCYYEFKHTELCPSKKIKKQFQKKKLNKNI